MGESVSTLPYVLTVSIKLILKMLLVWKPLKLVVAAAVNVGAEI